MRLADTLVPKIGRFSNTQNKIQMSDLSANDPPHVELWHISQKSQAPDPTGGTKTCIGSMRGSRGLGQKLRICKPPQGHKGRHLILNIQDLKGLTKVNSLMFGIRTFKSHILYHWFSEMFCAVPY